MIGRRHRLSRDPRTGIYYVKVQIEKARKRFTDDELSTLFSVILERFGDFKDALLFGLLTGLRPQEIRQLEKQHILRDGNGELFLYLERHKTARSARKPICRSVPLTAESCEIVRRQLRAHPDKPHLFLNDDGNPFKPRAFRLRPAD